MTPDVKVSRDGTVSADGAPIGRVEKVLERGMYATLLGASATDGGTPRWYAYGAEGNKLSDVGYDTRKRAVARVAADSQPLAVSDVRVGTSWLRDDPYVSASVRWRGFYFGVSRYAGESEWVVDCLFTPGCSMPTFSNGDGSRCTKATVLKPDMADAVTAAATAAGVWPIAA